MKRRKWVLQNHAQDADWTVLEQLIHQDEILQLSTVEHTDSAETFGGDYIPVGDIPFVAGWLWKNCGKKMEPIEVPECLRKPEYLKRKYYFTDKRNLPFQSRQKYFVKNISELKVFNSALYDGAIPGWNTLPEGKYLVSEWINILSEFRIFVLRDRVISIQPYLGMPLMFPNANKIRKMIREYSDDPKRPGAYTMDIAVSKDRDDVVQTVLLEVHPFVSCGLYGCCNSRLPDMLEEGIRYYTGQ